MISFAEFNISINFFRLLSCNSKCIFPYEFINFLKRKKIPKAINAITIVKIMTSFDCIRDKRIKIPMKIANSTKN